MNCYGHFDDAAREYVITRPDTPWPWINYMGTGDFFSLISNTAGGYCFCRDAKFRRILRYRYNGVPMDAGGRYFYIKDGDTVWNPGWKPCKTPLDLYECRHGMGYTRICGEKGGLRAETLFFVPLEQRCEVHRVKLTNRSDSPKQIQLYAFVEWCLWNASTDMENFQRNLSTGEVEVGPDVLFHKTEYRERRNHYAFYGANRPFDGFDTDREAFLGMYNGFDAPEQVLAGTSANSVAHGWSPVAAERFDLTLAPGASEELIFVLGYVENPAEAKFEAPGVINKAPARAMRDAFATDAQADAAFADLRAYWDDLLGRFSVASDVPELDRTVNIWNQYQCMITFFMSRSASYFESGIGRGMGFRDSNQDLAGIVHLIPDRARQRILDIAATQFPDGGCYHQYQPLTKRGNNDIGGGFGDDPLWLLFGTIAYLKETGDFTILSEPVPFDNVPGSEVTLLEHLKISFRRVATSLGPHGLPLIGRADWNDCLNLNCFSAHPGESFQTYGPSEGPVAESVLIAGMFVKYGNEYADICDAVGDHEEAKRARFETEKMSDAVMKNGWDGEWFLRAYDAEGRKVGSKDCEEGKIYIESNGFCSLAGIGVREGLARKALDSVKERLDTEYGIMLLQPPYTRYHLELGEISSYPPGYKENAGIFCHVNPWVSIAETVIGRGSRAFEIYKKTCPRFLEDKSEIHRTEPYVYSQMVAGKDAPSFGEAKNSWLTGTAAWTFTNISQYILGVYPTLKGLRIDPCIPSDFGDYTVKRIYRGARYIIKIKNPSRVEKGVKSVIVNGEKIDGNVIPPAGVNERVLVEVTMG